MCILTDREVDVHEEEHVCDDEIGVLREHLAVGVVDVYDRVHLTVVYVLCRLWVDILQARLQGQQKSETRNGTIFCERWFIRLTLDLSKLIKTEE